MRRIALPCTLFFGALLALLLSAAPSHAQATGTWVSGVGDDVNPCSRTAPCKTFAGAISKTAINGEIRCLDPGGFGAVTITKSMTIDCHEIAAFVLASATTGVTINITTAVGSDPLQTVRLRNLNINGSGSCGAGCGSRTGIHGVNIIKANNVYLDDMRIDGFTQFGIRDNRNGSGLLFVRNSIVRDNAGTAIAVFPSAGTVGAVIEGSTGNESNFGISAGANSKVVVKRSVFSGNVTAGVNADNTGQISIDDSVISNNTAGIQANAGSTVRLSNNDIGLNANNAINGATTSFGNNRIYPTVGTAPTPAGADSHDKGQQ